MQALTLGYIQEIEDKFPLLKTTPRKLGFMVLEGIMQTSKGGKQSITLPNYEAYKHSNHQNNTITFTGKPWHTYFGDNLQLYLDLRLTQQEREAMSGTENQAH